MPFATFLATWVSMLVFTVPLALLLMFSLPTGCLVQIAAHAVLLAAGAIVALRICPRAYQR